MLYSYSFLSQFSVVGRYTLYTSKLHRESGLRVALRVLVLIRLKTREDKLVAFRRTHLRRCFQVYKNERSFGNPLAVSVCRSLPASHR